MATSGTIQGTTKNSSGTDITAQYGTWITWKRNSTNVAKNTSNITVTLYVQRVDGYTGETAWNLEDKPIVTLKVGGSAKTVTTNYVDTRNEKLCTITSWTGDVTHNANGTLSLAISCYWVIPNMTYLANGYISGTATLDTIPRNPTVTLGLVSKTETSVKMTISSDSVLDYMWASLDNGATWSLSMAMNSASGAFSIQNLQEHTTYNIKVRVRRKDSQLTTDSSTVSVQTYYFPHCTSAPNFTIGNTVTLGFYNPLGRNFAWKLIGADGSDVAWTNTTGTSYTGVNGERSVNNLYKSIPNAKSGTYKIEVAYDGVTHTKAGGTYTIKGTEVPTVNSLTYTDTNSKTVAMTGNNQHIVQNYSTLVAEVGSATANYGAGGIASYKFECNGISGSRYDAGAYSFATINSSNDVDLKVTVTDTRGLSATKTIKVKMIPHNVPSALVTLERLNNYEDEAYLTVDGSVSNINSKNTTNIKYRYKKSGGSYNSYTTINDRQKYTFTLDKGNVYIFNVVVTDALGSTFSGEYVLNKGVFPLFIDTGKNAVGVNCFPNNDNGFEVDGLISASRLKCKNLLYTPYTESNKLTQTATRDDFTITTGYYCRLEKGKKYTFSCKSDGAWGGGNGTDTVEVFLLKDKAYDTIISIVGNPKTFSPTASGVYFLRCDVNKNGATHSFWDFQIEEGSVATEYVEAKQFEYQEQYYQQEHKVGYWFNGKPIYRQLVSLGASHFGAEEVTEGKNLNFAHNIPNIEDIVKFEDIWCTSNQYRHFPTNFYGNERWDGHYYCTETEICFELDMAVLNRLITSTTFFYIILYYTKTTD
jgi:hypothetical protein